MTIVAAHSGAVRARLPGLDLLDLPPALDRGFAWSTEVAFSRIRNGEADLPVFQFRISNFEFRISDFDYPTPDR